MSNNYKGIQGFAMNMIQNNPQLRNNPQFAQMIKAIESGDSAQGQQLAENILRNYGVTKEEAIGMAVKRFNLPG